MATQPKPTEAVVERVPAAPPALAPESPETAMLRLAIEQRAPIETIERMVALMEKERARRAEADFSAAMTRFKTNAPHIIKNKHVSYATKSGGTVDYWHATLDHACEELIPALAAVGISHSWKVTQSAELITVLCLLKGYGHREEVQMIGLPDTSGDKSPLKAFCSTVTYLQRYTLLAACGLAASNDDDGAGGNGKSGMDAAKLEEYCRQMGEVGTLADLKTLWERAYPEAQEANDRKAMAQLIAAKDAAKKRGLR